MARPTYACRRSGVRGPSSASPHRAGSSAARTRCPPTSRLSNVRSPKAMGALRGLVRPLRNACACPSFLGRTSSAPQVGLPQLCLVWPEVEHPTGRAQLRGAQHVEFHSGPMQQSAHHERINGACALSPCDCLLIATSGDSCETQATLFLGCTPSRSATLPLPGPGHRAPAYMLTLSAPACCSEPVHDCETMSSCGGVRGRLRN